MRRSALREVRQEGKQMQETEQLIAIYHTGFIICLCLTILFAVLSVVIFFKFKIRRVFDFLTGRAQKRTIRQMEEENAQTGKLRQDTYVPETTGDLYKTPSGSIPPVIYPPTGEVATGSEPTEKMHANAAHTQTSGSGIQSGGRAGSVSQGDERTEILPEGSEETTLLQGDGSEETTLLNGGAEETTLLSGSADETTVPLYGAQGETMLLTPELEKAMREEREKKAYSGRFEIIKETMLIHTEERI